MQLNIDKKTIPYISSITNRIKYLDHKNQSVNKKMLAYMNSFERRLLSERSQDSQPNANNKTCLTFRINDHSKKAKLKSDAKKQKSDMVQSIQRRTEQGKQNNTRSQERQKQFKILNHLKSVNQKKSNRYQLKQNSFNHKDTQTGNASMQSLKRGRKFLDQTRNTSTKQSFYPHQQQLVKSTVKTNNFLITQTMGQKKSPYSQILNNLRQRKQKKPNQEKLKLIEIKKKLLEEEERSLMEYEKCVLYKQKIVQKIRHQQLGPINTGTDTKKNSVKQSEVYIYANDDDQ